MAHYRNHQFSLRTGIAFMLTAALGLWWLIDLANTNPFIREILWALAHIFLIVFTYMLIFAATLIFALQISRTCFDAFKPERIKSSSISPRPEIPAGVK